MNISKIFALMRNLMTSYLLTVKKLFVAMTAMTYIEIYFLSNTLIQLTAEEYSTPYSNKIETIVANLMTIVYLLFFRKVHFNLVTL